MPRNAPFAQPIPSEADAWHGRSAHHPDEVKRNRRRSAVGREAPIVTTPRDFMLETRAELVMFALANGVIGPDAG
jgi:hypothetical protein